MTLDEMNKKYGRPPAQGSTSLASLWGAPVEKKSLGEKVLGFTGGDKIAQGLGQAIANPQIAKQQETALNDALKQQTELLKRKKEIEALGGDTSHIDKGLAFNKESLDSIGNNLGGLLNQKNITTKEVLGDALQLGTTVAGVGTYSKAGLVGNKTLSTGLQKAAPSVVKGVTGAATFGKGALQGAKTGAIAGGAYGAASGVASGLKENEDLTGIAKKGLGGALIGAGTGGLIGGVVGGISGGIKGSRLAKLSKEDNHALDLVSPKATEAVKQQALKEGRVSEQGLFTGAKILPSKRDVELADAVKGVVSSKKSPTQNIEALKTKVGEINTGVKAYVAEKKVPFNTRQLGKQLNNGKDELKLIFAGDKQSEKTYQAVVKEFMKHVDKKDTAGLLDARQSFDKIPAIKKLLDSQGLGENTKKEIVLTVRSQANKYIANLLPKGNQYRAALLKESRMLEAIENIADKNTGIIGVNKLQAFTKKNPIGKAVAGGLGAGLGLGAVGVGSAIINSTD